MHREHQRVGGFDESLVTLEDTDFGLRLKAHGRPRDLHYGTMWLHAPHSSCRKFDTFGDWYLFLKLGMVKAIFSATDRRAADPFYHDVER